MVVEEPQAQASDQEPHRINVREHIFLARSMEQNDLAVSFYDMASGYPKESFEIGWPVAPK
jgi:hypothetical protein